MDPVFRDFHFTWGKTAGIEAVMSGVGADAPDRGPSLAGWASADPAAASAWLRDLELSDSAYDPLIKVRALANTNPPENPWDFRDIALPWAGKSPFYITPADSLYAMNPLTAILAAVLPASPDAGLEINHIELAPSPQP
jgi:hypothetical protein